MLITCPSCSKKYSIKAQALGSKGRTVKCKNCGHKWFQSVPGTKAVRPQPDSSPESSSESSPEFSGDNMTGEVDEGFEKADQIADPPPIPAQLIRADDTDPQGKKGVIGWLVLLVLLGGLGGAGYVFSDKIIQMVPLSAKLFEAVGAHVPYAGEGLDLRELPAERRDEDGIDVLVISAEVSNISDVDRNLPVVRVELLDPLDRVVQRKDIRAEVMVMTPGETLTVQTKIRNPNPNATQLSITFIDPKQEAQ